MSKRFAVGLLLGAALLAQAALTNPGRADPFEVERGDEGHVPAMVYDFWLLPAGQGFDREVADLDHGYAEGMKQHHEMAVAMSRDYLADRRGRHPLLRRMAQGIIDLQRFEIATLDEVAAAVRAGPRTVMTLGDTRLVKLARGPSGREHRERYLKWPSPGPLALLASEAPVSDFDVKFAREMILHHQAALDMARVYDAHPKASNPVIGSLNIDIRVGQSYEIAYLEEIVGRYPGDPAAVPIDESMGRMMWQPGKPQQPSGHDGHRH